MADEECIDEKLVEAVRHEFVNVINDIAIDTLAELRVLDGHPLHGLRTTLLERLRRKYPELTFEEVDVFVKHFFKPSGYKLLTD